MFDNIILLTDSYKVSHSKQYPPGTTSVYSYFESRGGEFDRTVFVGLQYFLKHYLQGVQVTPEKIAKANRLLKGHLPAGTYNPELWQYIVDKHSGRLPVEIKAVPEGTVVPTGNVLMTVENTDPNCYWLTNYLETLLVQVWYPSTVSTVSREMKKIIKAALERSSDSLAGLDFKLHDFGFRGVSSVESGGTGGFGHLVNFMGTDTLASLEVADEIYSTLEGAGVSIPASEHSTITSWGKDGELEAYRNMLTQYPTGLVACVSDSWDIYHAAKKLWGESLKKEVLGRKGVLVIRPDSGEPADVLPKLLSILDKAFEGTTNNKGYKILPDQVRVIQGDGINRRTLKGILDAVMDAGFSADNLAFGSGGGLLQDVNRDTEKFAFKCSQVIGTYGQRDVYKQPVGASWKKSKKGRQALVQNEIYDGVTLDSFATVNPGKAAKLGGDLLQTVFKNGEVTKEYTLAQLRERAKL